jgi:hypothetical protein
MIGEVVETSASFEARFRATTLPDISEQEQSGQSVAAFCRDRELAGSQFIY